MRVPIRKQIAVGQYLRVFYLKYHGYYKYFP